MSGRELITLGTASQVPTRSRAHHATFLTLDGVGVLFDPGEGTQRQLTLAGIAVSRIHHVCITHAHGDHCLGLPGVLQRAALDEVSHPIAVHHPHAAAPTVERLRQASVYDDRADVRLHPMAAGDVVAGDHLTITTAALAHSIPAIGYRVATPDTWRLDPQEAEEQGVHGPDRARLLREGSIRIGERTVTVEQVASPQRGTVVAFVMDTGWCAGALELAAGADLLVVEATFLASEAALAAEVGHLTAGDAARLGQQAGARRVVLTHLSQRYPTIEGHLAEARAAAPDLDVHVARDLDRFEVPRPPVTPPGAPAAPR
ncbi:MAG: MBL fold metallo-hydrolase [Nitriliruptoraceae bacterium]|nr:MBL fold metallo-hydrolase [Nitriliruptoraceae bacterium]